MFEKEQITFEKLHTSKTKTFKLCFCFNIVLTCLATVFNFSCKNNYKFSIISILHLNYSYYICGCFYFPRIRYIILTIKNLVRRSKRVVYFSNECDNMELNKKAKVVRLSFTHDKIYNQDKQTFVATKIFSYSTGIYENKPKMHHSLLCVLCDLPKKAINIQHSRGKKQST